MGSRARQGPTPTRALPGVPIARPKLRLIGPNPRSTRSVVSFPCSTAPQALPSPRPRITAADRAQTPSRPAGTQSMPLARTPKGRAFTAASTPAGLIPRGEPPDPTQCPLSNRWFLTSLSPLLTVSQHARRSSSRFRGQTALRSGFDSTGCPGCFGAQDPRGSEQPDTTAKCAPRSATCEPSHGDSADPVLNRALDER